MSNERRESFRCRVPSVEAPAVLRVGSKDLVVQVLEESAGGFAIRCPSSPDVKPGERVALGTGSGCCEVRIVYKREVENGFRVGLQRLREVKTSMPTPSEAGSPSYLRSLPHTLGAVVVLGACLVLLVGAIYSGDGGTLLGWVFGAEEKKAAPIVTVRLPQPETETELATDYLKMGHFKTPKIVLELKLDRKQQLQIGGIMKETTAALSAIYDKKDEIEPQHWAELGLQVMQRSKEEVFSVMNEEQRRSWLEMEKSHASSTK